MSIKITALIMAMAAILVTTPALIVGAQLTYAQQGSSTNSNFQAWEQAGPPRYRLAIPPNWIGPVVSPLGDISFQSPDQSQAIQISKRLPGLNTIQQWIDAEIQDLASKGKRPDQDVQRSWQGIHPTRILMYPDHISIWIEAYTRFYNIAADGAVMNGKSIDQTITEILNSFQIQEPTPQEFQQIAYENNVFYCLALRALSSTYRCLNY
jgi:hypothetical protein